MTIQFSVAVRNAMLDAFESTVGTSAVLKIFDGSIPANCAAADAGTILATLSLPSDWMAAASGGTKAKSGTWNASASASGTAQYFRVYDSGVTACGNQGTCSLTGGGGDMTIDNTSLAPGQSFTVTSFTLTAGNP